MLMLLIVGSKWFSNDGLILSEPHFFTRIFPLVSNWNREGWVNFTSLGSICTCPPSFTKLYSKQKDVLQSLRRLWIKPLSALTSWVNLAVESLSAPKFHFSLNSGKCHIRHPLETRGQDWAELSWAVHVQMADLSFLILWSKTILPVAVFLPLCVTCCPGNLRFNSTCNLGELGLGTQ